MSAPATGGGYSCNVTVGVFSGVFYGYFSGLMGSIDAEPIPGEILVGFYWTSNPGTPVVWFNGDITSTVSGLDVYFDGVQVGDGGDWAYNSVDNRTELTCFDEVDYASGTYLLEIK